jgi:hypothetical protein
MENTLFYGDNLFVLRDYIADINWDILSKIAFWLVTSFMGAFLVKLFDVAYLKFTDRRSQKKEKVSKLLKHVDDYATLADLYRFYARSSSKLIPLDNDTSTDNWIENARVEHKIFEPEERFERAINEMNGAPLDEVILQRIVSIRIASSEILDISDELDPSEELKKQFTDLYIKTIYVIDKILENKNQGDPIGKFQTMFNALNDASEARKKLRNSLNKLNQ